jgi:CYTH domain-containing protein
MPEWAFAQLWPLTESRRVHKQRCLVTDGANTLSIDFYGEEHDAMCILECEFVCEEDAIAFTPPKWLQPCVEVTHDPAFKNKNLAR